MNEQSPLPRDNDHTPAEPPYGEPWPSLVRSQNATGYLDAASRAEAAAVEQAASASYAKTDAARSSAARRRLRWLIILVPLFLCLITSTLAAVVAAPLRNQLQSSAAPRVPVTGGDPPLAVTTDPTAAPHVQTPSPLIAQTYRDTAVDHLTTCMSSFHDFFIMEELAAHQPDVLQNDTWQSDVTQAMNSFRDDCQKLGSLPDAPPSFTEFDHWLKLAAAEVGPATDGFNSAMKSQQQSDLRGSIRHMMRFVECAQNAEAILSGMEQRREI